MKTLVGKTVIFKADEIAGPRQVACKGPRYIVKDYPADMLFQGAFGEMHSRDQSVDPQKLAAKLGFKGKSWQTLEPAAPRNSISISSTRPQPLSA